MKPGDSTGRVWDAVVVGAGPAGAVAARELARRGADVLLVDKATFPRAKVCGCCLNGAALEALAAVGLGDLPKACGAVPLRSVRLAAGRSTAEVRLPGGVSLSREAFDLALVQEAVAAGVTFWPGLWAKVEERPARSRADHRSVVLRQGGEPFEVAARVVIAASGLAGGEPAEPRPPLRSRLGAGTIVPEPLAPAFFAPGTIYMATDASGYVGLVRLEDRRLDVAAAFDPDFVRACGGLGAAAVRVLSQTNWPAIRGLERLPWKGTPALTRRPAAVAGPRQFAVGDAAGYVEPFTGEGMAWAIASAVTLAPIAHRAALQWNDSLVGEWERAHNRAIGRRQGVCRVAARVLRSPLLTRLVVRTVTLLPGLSRPVVAFLNRPPILPHGPIA